MSHPPHTQQELIPPPAPRLIECRHCDNVTRSSPDAARAAGWRWYNGTTRGGAALVDVVCPWCAGTTDDDAELTELERVHLLALGIDPGGIDPAVGVPW